MRTHLCMLNHFCGCHCCCEAFSTSLKSIELISMFTVCDMKCFLSHFLLFFFIFFLSSFACIEFFPIETYRKRFFGIVRNKMVETWKRSVLLRKPNGNMRKWKKMGCTSDKDAGTIHIHTESKNMNHVIFIRIGKSSNFIVFSLFIFLSFFPFCFAVVRLFAVYLPIEWNTITTTTVITNDSLKQFAHFSYA